MNIASSKGGGGPTAAQLFEMRNTTPHLLQRYDMYCDSNFYLLENYLFIFNGKYMLQFKILNWY
jgi:hypothetical protein